MKSRFGDLVIAFYPHARGFAYVVFEGPLSPVDWGMSDVPAKEKAQKCLRRLSQLLDRYQPDVLLVRGITKAPRISPIARLLICIEEEARGRGQFIAAVSRKQIRETFVYLGAPTRRAIVEAIVKKIPMLASHSPPPRKIWNGEDRRMGLFDATAMAVAFFEKKKDGGDETP
jgi:hypothetical protein